MKIKYLKLKNWLLMSAMGLLGLQACHSQKDVTTPDNGKDDRRQRVEDRIVPMYGVRIDDRKTKALLNGDDTTKRADKGEKADTEPPRDPQVTVYGVPTVDFAVKGKVVDGKGRPIKGAQVILINSDIDPDNLPETEYWQGRLREITDTTDAQGNFEVQTTDRPWEKVRVMVRDIDGKKNGSYEDQVTDVDFGEPESGDRPMNRWKLGVRKGEVTVKMKTKKK